MCGYSLKKTRIYRLLLYRRVRHESLSNAQVTFVFSTYAITTMRASYVHFQNENEEICSLFCVSIQMSVNLCNNSLLGC